MSKFTIMKEFEYKLEKLRIDTHKEIDARFNGLRFISLLEELVIDQRPLDYNIQDIVDRRFFDMLN